MGVKLGKRTKWYGFPVVQRHKDSYIYIGNDVEVRNWTYSNPLGVNHPLILTTWCKNSRISIGDRSGITGGTICAAAQITIGSDTLIGANCMIIDTDFHPIDHRHRKKNKSKGKMKPISIGNNVFVGTGTTILKGVSIGNNSVVGAGTIVSKDAASNCVIAGNPAKLIKRLNQ
jgi:acetyltransferase-like isoleucine patch superfamily enzyme